MVFNRIGALTRNLLRAVDFLPFLYAFGLVAMLLNRDFKRLGDLAERGRVSGVLAGPGEEDDRGSAQHSAHSVGEERDVVSP